MLVAFGKAVASDDAGRHKGDACLRFPPSKHCDASFVGDPLTGKAGGYRLWVMGNGDGAISALTANLLR